MKIKKLKDIIKDLPDDMEILANSNDGLSDHIIADIRIDKHEIKELGWTAEDCKHYTGLTVEEYEKPFLNITFKIM
ncbi:hypothetical protein ACFX18_09075 [Lactococcus garvieae]|uniref:hypothetical protein n=1 Tax=Lactococcus garvieae TaxID=1363 RepID=UPI003D174DF3